MRGTVDVMVELLYMKLEEHLKAIEAIERLSRSMTPSDLGGGGMEELLDAVARLRSLRSSLITDVERVLSKILGGEVDKGPSMEPLYALAGYYAEAAYHAEVRILGRLGLESCDSDMEDAARLRSLFQEIIRILE